MVNCVFGILCSSNHIEDKPGKDQNYSVWDIREQACPGLVSHVERSHVQLCVVGCAPFTPKWQQRCGPIINSTYSFSSVNLQFLSFHLILHIAKGPRHAMAHEECSIQLLIGEAITLTPLSTIKTNSYHFCKLSIVNDASAKIKQTEFLKDDQDLEGKKITESEQSGASGSKMFPECANQCGLGVSGAADRKLQHGILQW
ncbi:hypothetical protein Pfo_021537 [Paulownia fortunei]|nr:hypothetical protein Pfo_021537 [Paulownia fortunei]